MLAAGYLYERRMAYVVGRTGADNNICDVCGVAVAVVSFLSSLTNYSRIR